MQANNNNIKTSTTMQQQQTNRVPSTVKKSQSTTSMNYNKNIDTLGKYRQLGPKIHQFAGFPQSQIQSPNANIHISNYQQLSQQQQQQQQQFNQYQQMNQYQMQEQYQQNQQSRNGQTNGGISSPTQNNNNINVINENNNQQKYTQSGQNIQINLSEYKNHSGNNQIIINSGNNTSKSYNANNNNNFNNNYSPNNFNNNNNNTSNINNNNSNNNRSRNNQKKNSISTIGSPQNVSNRSSGWVGHGLLSQDMNQMQYSSVNSNANNSNVINNNINNNNNNKNNNNNSNVNNNSNILNNNSNTRNGFNFENQDSVQSMEQLSESENITNNNNLLTLKMQLRTIFHFYTTFGDRQNINYLKSNKFYKMMSDANIISNTLNVNRLDLLFCQANKHQANMSFQTFLDLLPKLAILKYPDYSNEDAMLTLITHQLNPLYISIMEKTDLGIELRNFNQPLEIDCIEVLQPLYPILQKIYESYFKWEATTSMTKEMTYNKSLKAIYQFLSEYNICPTYFSKSTAFLLYNYLVELKHLNLQFAVSESTETIFGFKDYGVNFSFQRFLLYLIRSSIICYDNKLDSSKYTCTSLVEKLNLLLEKMEISEGFLNIQKKTHITNNSHTSLLIPSQLVMRLSQNKSIDWSTPRTSQYSSFRSKLNSGQQSTRQQSFYNPPASGSPSRNNSNLRKSFLAEKLGQSFVTVNVFERNNEALQKIFKHYCSFGEPMNQSTLKTIKLIRLLTDAGIMKKISTSQNNSLNLSEVRGLNKSITSNNLRGSQTPQTAQANMQQLQSSLTSSAQQQQSLSNRQQFSFLNNSSGDQYQQQLRYLNKIDMDFMVIKLTGHKWIKNFNSQANQFDTRIASPKLGFQSHLYKNDDSQGAKGKIEYEHFLKILEMIAEKLYPELELERSLQIIIEGQIIKLIDTIQPNRKGMHDYLANLMDILKDQEIVNLLGEVHLSLVMYYKIYQDQKGYMNVANFIKFFQDFDIFPNLVSKAKLQAIFYTLAQVQANQKNTKQKNASETMQNNSSQGSQLFLNQTLTHYAQDQNEMEIIDQHLFVEGIALLAIEIYSEKQTNIHKIIMILERMNSSQGPIKIQKSLGHTRSPDGLHWDLLHNIRKKYPEFYKRENYATLTSQTAYCIDPNQSTTKSFTQNNMNNNSQLGRFDDVMKKSLSSIKLQNSINLNLSQQYILQQKDINERSQFYSSNNNNNNSNNGNQLNHENNNNNYQINNGQDRQSNIDNQQQQQQQQQQLQQHQQQQQQQNQNEQQNEQNGDEYENQNSPINSQNKNNINSYDVNSTAKKGKSTPSDKNTKQLQQHSSNPTYESPNFLNPQTPN